MSYECSEYLHLRFVTHQLVHRGTGAMVEAGEAAPVGRWPVLAKKYRVSKLSFLQDQYIYTSKFVRYSHEFKLSTACFQAIQLKFESQISLRNIIKVSNYIKK